ncbi:MAG: hypothetical protein AAF546_13555 [Verrucomicrobiota bacterium]
MSSKRFNPSYAIESASKVRGSAQMARPQVVPEWEEGGCPLGNLTNKPAEGDSRIPPSS